MMTRNDRTPAAISGIGAAISNHFFLIASHSVALLNSARSDAAQSPNPNLR